MEIEITNSFALYLASLAFALLFAIVYFVFFSGFDMINKR